MNIANGDILRSIYLLRATHNAAKCSALCTLLRNRLKKVFPVLFLVLPVLTHGAFYVKAYPIDIEKDLRMLRYSFCSETRLYISVELLWQGDNVFGDLPMVCTGGNVGEVKLLLPLQGIKLKVEADGSECNSYMCGCAGVCAWEHAVGGVDRPLVLWH